MEDTDLTWRKASKSGNGGSNCVEVGSSPASPVVGIRDTTARERGHITVSHQTFAALVERIKRGELDL